MDKIANLIVGLKNAGMVSKEKAFFPYSKLIWNIAELLKKEGYVKAVHDMKADTGNPADRYIEVVLEYVSKGVPRISIVERVSKLSQRIYMKSTEIRPFKYGKGLVVVSTPKGLLTDKEAKKELVGGEILFRIF
jgi:small subunit ribosomal protein S8